MDIDVTIGNDVTMKGGALAGLGRIDQYELVKELGGGGFGCVFLAMDTVAGVEVAVKGLPPEVKHNKEELENIRENFALVSRLHHPNIAAALVLHPAKDVTYANRDTMEKLRVFEGDTLMVMEYAPGTTLSSWRKQFPGKRVPPEIAADIVRQVASALDYAHDRKIVHRDIKPANVMIEPGEAGKQAVRVLDFGLAAEIRSSMGRVSREIRDMSGTRPYMAPEQWGGEKQGPATDQYALAVMFCELVSGEVPYQSAFESGDSVVMMANVLHQPLKMPELVPDRFRKALERALAKKPVKRFSTCMDFVTALSGRSFPWMPVILGVCLTVLAVVACWRFAARGRSAVATPEPPSAVLAAAEPVASSPAPKSEMATSAVVVVKKRVAEKPVAEKPVAEKPVAETVRKETVRKETVVKPVGQDGSIDRERLLAEARLAAEKAVAEQRKKDLEAARIKVEQDAQKAETERKAREEAERKARAEAERKAREEAERKAKEAAAKLPPALRVVARIDGREVSGAKMKTLSGEVELPCKWEGRIFRGRSLGPYDVTYREGTTDYHGEFKVSVDWAGEKTAYVDLIRGKLAEKYKGTGRWF